MSSPSKIVKQISFSLSKFIEAVSEICYRNADPVPIRLQKPSPKIR